VALELLGQFPEITRFAQAAIDDTAKAHEATLASDSRSREMVHEIHIQRLMILKAELGKDLSPEQRIRVYDDIREVNSNVLAKDSESKRFLSEQFDKRLQMVLGTAVTVAAVVATVARSGNRSGTGSGFGRLFKS
jgi:hypothetical protein